jgi:hypothetical protein
MSSSKQQPATRKVFRSAETGEFVRQKVAEQSPKTHVRETIKVAPPKK